MNRKLTKTVQGLTGKRFCTHCQKERPIEGGKLKTVRSHNRTRWICADCIKNRGGL